LIGLQLKEKQRKYKFSLSEEEIPTEATIAYFYIINALDVWTTYKGVKSGKAKETNPLLPNSPKLGELVTFKVAWSMVAFERLNQDEIEISNTIVTMAVINNLNVLHRIDEL
tara:strand:+ start:221 stop:556 length:336 start_codon:yes stop_codon:yes gene_type:complete